MYNYAWESCLVYGSIDRLLILKIGTREMGVVRYVTGVPARQRVGKEAYASPRQTTHRRLWAEGSSLAQ